MDADKDRIVRCTVVGDCLVGKTTLIKRFIGDRSTDEPVSTIFDNFATNVHTADGEYTVSIYDTTGQHDMAGLRHYPYAQSDIVIVCYSAEDRTTFDNALQFWIPEAKTNTKNDICIVIMAICNDLTDADVTAVRRNEGISFAKKVDAYSFVETTKNDCSNLSKLFEVVVMKIMKKRKTAISKLFKT